VGILEPLVTSHVICLVMAAQALCVCVRVFVFPVAVDITKMISDRVGIPRLVCGTLCDTSRPTIIQYYPLVTAFLYPPPEDAHGCQCVPARCPRTHRNGKRLSSLYRLTH